jgi:hypothetical protein
MRIYDSLDGNCACRQLLLPFFYLAIPFVTLFHFAFMGMICFVVNLFVMFAVPCIIATIPAIRDL